MDMQTHLAQWLRDAHGAELQAVEVLEKQAARLESYPELQQRIAQHVVESRSQAERLEACLARYGSDSSFLKDAMAKMSGNLMAIGPAMADDEVVKNVLADYAYEHFEIACYQSLIAAADAVGDSQTSAVCREILREEEEMARFVEAQIPLITQLFLERDQMGADAKR